VHRFVNIHKQTHQLQLRGFAYVLLIHPDISMGSLSMEASLE
jgi:hypothetical protein